MEPELLTGLLNFAIYFAVSLVLLVVFKFIYAWVTPHDEWALIKDDQNIAASVAFGGAILGFALALAGAATNSVSLLDYVIWAVVALVAQVAAFGVVRFGFMPKIVERVENNEISAGIMLAAISIAVGVLNAACMSY